MQLRTAAKTLIACLLASALSVAASGEPADDTPEPIRTLELWTERCQKRLRSFDSDEVQEIRSMLMRTRPVARASFEGQRQVAVALLDVFGAGIRLADSLDSERAADGERLQQMAEFELSLSLDGPLVRWLSKQVLVSPERNPPERRAACALVLDRKDDDGLLMALATCAREEEGIVREAAVWALAGRQLESVHTMCMRLLQREDFANQSALFPALEHHFKNSQLGPETSVSSTLFEYVRERIASEDWRTAAHAIKVSSALETAILAPLLVEALEVWIERAEAGEPVRRIQHDLVQSLESRSGMALGAHAGRWRTWLRGLRAGQVPVRDNTPENLQTEASFFGIRPLTDRVVFLIDHSGSMNGRIKPGGGRSAPDTWTRYQEAVAQMISLLENMGPRTRFNVVLFDDKPQRWQGRLQNATPGRLKSVRSWLLSRPPKGSTYLRRGVQSAIGLTPGKAIDLSKTEADTLIVLCDGQTAEGSAWVNPVFREVQSRARWLVHCVQLGAFGDDTLELLAQLTGGDHVRL